MLGNSLIHKSVPLLAIVLLVGCDLVSSGEIKSRLGRIFPEEKIERNVFHQSNRNCIFSIFTIKQNKPERYVTLKRDYKKRISEFSSERQWLLVKNVFTWISDITSLKNKLLDDELYAINSSITYVKDCVGEEAEDNFFKKLKSTPVFIYTRISGDDLAIIFVNEKKIYYLS